jgi:imidazolonepropionase-like amidohydrolase
MQRHSSSRVVALLLLPLLIASLASCGRRSEPPAHADLLITNATVIDPGSARTIDKAAIAIVDGRIAAAGERVAEQFAAARTIDASGKFIVPAFTDMHVHWGNGTFAEAENLVQQTLARSLYYGVTRILNMGSNAASPAEIDSFRQKLEAGEWRGPQIYAVGSLLTVPGSHPTTTIYSPDVQKAIAKAVAAAPAQGPIDLMPIRAVTLIRSADDARAEVKRLAVWGANAIKLTVESGPGPFGDDHPQMSEEMVRAAVEAAHAANIPVIAHISARDDLEICLRAGVDAAAHASISGPFDSALHRQMGDARFFYAVTLDLYDGFLNWSVDPTRLQDPFLRETVTADEAGSMKDAGQIFARERAFFGKDGMRPILEHVRDAQRAGTRLLTGTDTGNPFAFPGYGVHQELRLMVEAGVAPMDALAAATSNPAAFFRQQDRWGSIKPGQAADLLILDGNPLEDIMYTRRIAHLIQRGVVVDRATLLSEQ